MTANTRLRETDNRLIRRLLTVVGARIALELRGIKCLPFEQSSMKKSFDYLFERFRKSNRKLRTDKRSNALFLHQTRREWTLSTLERVYNKDNEYRKAGIILSGLEPSEQLTKRMFDDERFEKQHELMKAVGEINPKFGKDTVRFGNIKTKGRWKMKQTRKSRSYTTN